MISFFVGFWVGFIIGIFIPILVFVLLARKPSLLLRLFLKVAGIKEIPPEAMEFLTSLSVLEGEKEAKVKKEQD